MLSHLSGWDQQHCDRHQTFSDCFLVSPAAACTATASVLQSSAWSSAAGQLSLDSVQRIIHCTCSLTLYLAILGHKPENYNDYLELEGSHFCTSINISYMIKFHQLILVQYFQQFMNKMRLVIKVIFRNLTG